MWTTLRAARRLKNFHVIGGRRFQYYDVVGEKKNGMMILNNSFATASKKKKKKSKASSDSGGASLSRAISQEDIQMHLEMVDPQNRVEV